MDANAAPASPVKTPEEVQAEVEMRMRDIGQRFGGALPEDNEELLRLLEEAEFWLTRVDQSPSESMYDALRPTTSALVRNELLEHPDPEVKVAVAACLTQVTKIATEEGAPYEDDVMKVVFKIIVETFRNLDDMNSPSFERRASILEIFARVRFCLLMLDLNLEQMVLDMFHYFFNTVSTNHSEYVTDCMENIMKFAILESDDVPVHAELASCLLQNLTKKTEETLPASFGLAERVLGLCRDRLKPVFHDLLKGTPLEEYSNVVKMLFQQDAGENSVATSEKHMAPEGNLSEKSVPDKSPKETSKVDLDQEGSNPSNTPTTAISSGAAPIDNVKPDSYTQKQQMTSGDEQILDSSKQTTELTSTDKQATISEQLISCDKVREPATVQTEKLSDVSSNKDHKLGSSIGSEMNEQSKVVKVNESLVVASHLSPETNDGDEKQLPETGNITAEESSKPSDTKPVVVKPKRGRPVGKKHASDIKSAKLDPITDSGRRAIRQLSKDAAKSSSTKAAEGDSVKKRIKNCMQKEDAISDNKDTKEDISFKEMVSPTQIDKSEGQREDSGASSRRKRLPETQETPLSKKNKSLDENLIGSRIQVWWPDDYMFYPGVVSSYDSSSNKHKVSYVDGDTEVLVLKEEIWEFIDEEQDTDPKASSNMRRGRKSRGSSSQRTKGGKTGTPQSDVRNPPKKRGRPRGVRSSSNMPNADRSVTPARLKRKVAEKDTQETPEIDSNSKKEGESSEDEKSPAKKRARRSPN